MATWLPEPPTPLDNVSSTTPHPPSTPRRVISLLVSLGLAAGILTASLPASASTPGTIVAWGYNAYGQTDVPAGLTDVTATAAGFLHSLALKSDGTVAAWGDNTYGQSTVPPGLSNVTAIAAGVYYSFALRSDATVVEWGDNTYGQTDVPAGLSNVTAIAGGGFHSLALKADGTVVAWGDNTYDQRTVPAGLSKVTAIAAGLFHSLALKSDGTVVAWGDNSAGQSSVPAGLSNVVAIAAGVYHSLAITSPVHDTDLTLDPEVTPNPVQLNGNATASANGSGDSGIASQSCNPVDTSALGSFTVSCTATDNAGNTAEGTASYTVTANVVTLPPLTKATFKRGSMAPVKFQLTDAGGALIPTAMAQQLSDACAATATFDGLTPVCAVYDATKGFFQANLKSSSSWAVGSVVTITIAVKIGGTTVATSTISITITR